MLTWLLPAGRFQRQTDPETLASIVVPGTYQQVASDPVGLLEAFIAIPRGFIAVIPVLLALSRRIGFGAVTALGMSVGAATVGAAFGPTNPFAAGIALQYADLAPMTTPGLRLAMLVAAVALWIGWTISQASRDDVIPELEDTGQAIPATGRDVLMLLIVLLPFPVYVYGLLQWDWGFNEFSAMFLMAGYTIALLAMLLCAGVPFTRWLKFAVPGAILMMLVGYGGMVVAMNA